MALDMNNFSCDMTEKQAIRSDRKLRIGIIGTGGIAHSHMKAYQHQPDVEIVAACDLIPGKAEAFLKEFEVEAPTFEDYKQMIDTIPMDAVSVCVYNRNHAVCTIYALEHGVNVLLEKPMTVTLDEAVAIMQGGKEERQDRLRRLPAASGREHADDQEDRRIRRAGPACITSRPAAAAVTASRSAGPRRSLRTTTAGIGAVGDIGCYSLDMVLNAIGYPKPLTVTGRASDFGGKTPEAYAEVGKPECAKKFSVDDFASAYIRLDGDVILDFRISWYMHMDTAGDTLLIGTKGGLRIPSTECWNGSFDKPMTLYHDVAGKPVETVIPLIKDNSNLWDKKIRSFLDAVITGGKAPVPTSQILYNQAIIDGIFKSNESGHEVEINIPEI